MKVNLKAIGKGIVAAGTLVGGAILALQTKKGLKDTDFEPTLEPLGDEPETIEAEEVELEEEQEEEPEEDKDEDE